MRQPLQILVLPYTRAFGRVRYAVLRIAGSEYYQGVTGGVEDDESPADAALREIHEEIGTGPLGPLLALDARASIPVYHFPELAEYAGEIYQVPEHAFGAEIDPDAVTLSSEHSEVRWLGYHDAHELLSWDSQRVALWELNERLSRAG